MASFDINITYPDEKQAELIAALRAYYGKKTLEDGTETDWTPLELRGMFQQYCVGKLKAIYKKHKLQITPPDDLDAA